MCCSELYLIILSYGPIYTSYTHDLHEYEQAAAELSEHPAINELEYIADF